MKIGVIMPKANMGGGFDTTFLGSKFSLSIKPGTKPEDFDKKQAELDREAIQSQKARERGISVPKYKAKITQDGNHIKQIRYETKGDIADVKNNPIRYKHLRNLFKNLYFMDSAGIFHNDLDPSHIFFSDDGQIEFDCFRYSVDFYKSKNGELKGNNGSIRTPDFMMPSNEDAFKEHFLGGYVDKLDEDDKHYFVKNYLMNKSDYHYKRADMLIKRGFNPRSKTVQYEDIQGDVFLNPSSQVVNFEVKKLEAYKLKRQAFTEWDEGGGACGHKIEPKRRFNAILLNLECMESMMDLRNEALYLAKYVKTPAERKYFKFETECAQKRIDDLYSDTRGMGSWNFNDSQKKIYLGSQDEKEFFLALYDEINPSEKFASKDIKDASEYYLELKERWNENLNNHYMMETKNL